MYSYGMRNKICLFFWGNGATIGIMTTLSKFFAPPVNENDPQYIQSLRKCHGLFATYRNERLNPAYAQRYYYYNMLEKRMLYLDGQARHRGQRQSDGVSDALPIWARYK